MRPLLPLAAALIAASACGTEPQTASDYIPDDDWSGPVVVHSPEDLDAAPRIEMVEVLRIGSLDGPEATQFFRVAGADVADNQLFVLDAGHSEVRVFDLGSGDFLHAFGGTGDGPGEFRSPSTVEVLGDTVIVADRSRISHFTPDGAFLGSRDAYATMPDGSRIRLSHSGRASFYTETYPQGRPPVDELYRDTTVVRRFDRATGEPGSEILRYPGQPQLLNLQERIVLNPIFGIEPVFMWGSDGRLYYSPNDAYRLDIFDAATGEEAVRLIVTLDLPPVTSEMVDERIAMDRGALDDAEERGDPNVELYRALLDRRKLPHGETRPLTNSMRMAEDGRFMMIRGDLDANPDEPGDPGHWDVFGPDGSIRGRLVTAPGANVRRFTGDYLVTRETDDLDVQYVVVYRLEPTP